MAAIAFWIAFWTDGFGFLDAVPPCSAAPQIQNVSLRGLTIGQKTRLVLTGPGLAEHPRIVAGFPATGEVIVSKAKPNQIEIEIAVSSEASPGVYDLRIATESGISNAVAIGLDHLRQLPFSDEIDVLPVALHGQLTGAGILKTSFNGAKGQHILIDVEAARLGSKLRPVIRLLDSASRQLAWSAGHAQLAGDARLEYVVPADGQYSVVLHDLLYKGAAPGFFRLKIGDLQTADIAFPPGVERGVSTRVSLLSFFPDPTRLTSVEVMVDGLAPLAPVTLPGWANLTGLQPRLMISDHAEVLETTSQDSQPQLIGAAPVAVNGGLSSKETSDEFTLTVKPGAKLRAEVYAQRIGSPLDAVLTARDPSGKQLTSNDDQADTADPAINIDVPAGVERIILSLKSLQPVAKGNAVYRIEILDRTLPDFSLQLETDRLNIPAGATQVLRVTAERRGYGGPIALTLPGLPAGVTLKGGLIPAGATVGLLTLTAPADQPSFSKGAFGEVVVVGRADAPNANIVRIARRAASPKTRSRPWARESVGWCVAKPAPLGVAWANGSPPQEFFAGVKNSVGLQLLLDQNAQDAIRVRMLTTQVVPKKKVKKGNRDVTVDDVERTLRLEGAPQFNVGSEPVAVQVITPADLPLKPVSVVFIAELLAADKKTVLASVTTPECQVTFRSPLQLQLQGEPQVEAKAGEGETGTLQGAISRLGGLAGPVTVTLEGLPKEYPAPKVVVSAESVDFKLPVAFPFGVKAGVLKNVKLVATAAPDPKAEKAVVRSNAVSIAVNVVAGEKPPEKEVKK